MRQMILSYMRRGQHQQLLRILFTLLLLTGRPPCIGPDLLSVSSQVGRKRKSIRRRSYLANNFNRIELGEIVQVALLCTQYVPAHRPEMSEVGQMLQWFRCSSDLDAAVHNCKFQSSCHHFSQWKVYIYPPTSVLSSNSLPNFCRSQRVLLSILPTISLISLRSPYYYSARLHCSRPQKMLKGYDICCLFKWSWGHLLRIVTNSTTPERQQQLMRAQASEIWTLQLLNSMPRSPCFWVSLRWLWSFSPALARSLPLRSTPQAAAPPPRMSFTKRSLAEWLGQPLQLSWPEMTTRLA